ncbi:MAG TPA: prohibitin family protein [Acidobacteriota bacterium]|nr:prohibitin family protein [Acidobacteriota bacterium]
MSYELSRVKGAGRAVRWVLAGVLVLLIGFGSCGTVNYGERGVLLRFGAVTGSVKNEGLYFKIPLIDHVEILDIKTKKSEVDADASTKDLQMVTSKVALNYHINPSGIDQFFQKFGNNFESNVLDPGLQEILKAVTARYTAEEVITKREQVREDTNTLLRERFLPQGMVIDGLNIVNFHFSKVFNDAIEAKVTAEQNALAAKNKLEQVKFEAQQMVEAANGKAKAIQVEASAIANNPLVLQLRALEKWNGILPQYVGSGSIPFIQMK